MISESVLLVGGGMNSGNTYVGEVAGVGVAGERHYCVLVGDLKMSV